MPTPHGDQFEIRVDFSPEIGQEIEDVADRLNIGTSELMRRVWSLARDDMKALGDRYEVALSTTFDVIYCKETDGRWIAEVEALPGCLAYGPTRAAAREAVIKLAVEITKERRATERLDSK